MTAATTQQYSLYICRFQTFQTQHVDLPFLDQAVHFLSSLTPASVRVAKYALEWHLGQKIPYSLRRRPYFRNESRLEATVLRRPELRRLRSSTLSPRERALLGVLFSLRRAEAAHLRWNDLDLAEGRVSVLNGKGGKSDWTVLTKFAIEALAECLAVATRANVFPGPDGTEQSPDAIGKQVRDILIRIQLYRPYRGAHAFRRTFATTFLRKHPGELRALQKLMRHENFVTTSRYDFPRLEDLSKKVAHLGL